MNEEYIIWGTEAKYLVTLSGPGFDMNTDQFSVAVSCAGRTQYFSKADMVYDSDEDKWYLCFDTKPFLSGTMVATVTGYIPDDDFPGGFREEVVRQTLGQLKK